MAVQGESVGEMEQQVLAARFGAGQGAAVEPLGPPLGPARPGGPDRELGARERFVEPLGEPQDRVAFRHVG